MNTIILVVAIAVLIAVACRLKETDPARALVAPVAWSMWTAAHIAIAVGMLATVMAVTSPTCGAAGLAAALNALGGVLLLVVSGRRRAGR